MSHRTDNIALVRKAQLGDKESLNRLAEIARVRLHQYVLRMTLSDDLAQDIAQETILEMFRIFNKLRHAERFWGWLHGIAFNKVRNHYGKRWRRRTRSFAETGYEPELASDNDTLAQVVTEELKQIVVRSMAQLPPQHRAILTMRCYDHLSYAQIAKLLACSEIGARAAFYRAKKSLARRLSEYGLGKGSLLIALVAFGKFTATSEAGAAQVAVTSATLQVGPMAALAAGVTAKTGLVILAAGTLAAGSVALRPGRIPPMTRSDPQLTMALPASPWPSQARGKQECWYYFPEESGRTVMLRLLQSETPGQSPACHVLQNQYANYHFDPRAATVHINNHRAWNPDLTVMRLPTDSADLSDFLAHVEGRGTNMERTGHRRSGLLVICNRQAGVGSRIWRIDRHFNVLDEEYFHAGWAESTPIVDRRDTMHRRGWTYFRITGHLDGRAVSGAGRLPFVHAAAHEHPAWLRIRMGREATFIDTPTGTRRYDREGRVEAHFPGGSLFRGLPRPWTGLHAIDTIRRDAAAHQLLFETTYDRQTGCAKVTVYAEPVTLAYTVNLETDIVETIGFSTERDGEPTNLGELRFTYLQDIPEPIDPRLATPSNIRRAGPARQAPGILWLAHLAATPQHR